MKKNVLALLLLNLFAGKTYSTVFNVAVANFQFTPANLPNVLIGDTIRWTFVSGTHTTTCDPVNNVPGGNSLPSGAASWDAPITAGITTFNYIVTVPGTYKYSCKPHQLSQGMKASFTASAVLPVVFRDFKLNALNSKPALSWKTSTEQNTDYFSVRRSYNGSSYTEIAKVPASGNSVTEKNYSYTDNTFSANDRYAYYVVAVVDKDGKTKFTEVQLFKNTIALPKLITSISPNPISKSGHLMLQFNADRPGDMQVKVLSSEGKVVIETEMYAVAGVNSGHVHMGNLPSGRYTMMFSLNGIKEIRQVVVK